MRLLYAAVLLLISTSASAQIQSTVINHRVSAPAAATIRSEGSQPSSAQAQGLAFSITQLQDSLSFPNDGNDHPFTGTFKNLTDSVLQISFRRFQNLPFGWSTSICFGGDCLADVVDTPTAKLHLKPFSFPPHDSEQFIMHMYDVAGGSLPTSVTVYLRLTALTGNPGDTIMLTLTGTSVPAQGVTMQLASANQALSVFPNPVADGQPLSVQVYADRAESASCVLYDVAGRVIKNFDTQHRLIAGENRFSLGSLNLPSGMYSLRLTTNSGAKYSRTFQAIR